MLNTTPEQSDAIAAIITDNPGRVLSRCEALDSLPDHTHIVYDGSSFLIDPMGRIS